MKTISIPINDRPHLLARVLASIRANEAWRDWCIVVSCEPPLREATEQLLIATPSVLVQRNATRLGCWHNTFSAAMLAMSLSPSLNLYLEDDYLLSPDALALADQWDASGRDGILALRRPHVSQLPAPAIVSPCASGLFGCGFAWRSASWPTVRRQWFADAPMWDLAMEGLPLPQWRPFVNRSHGIGTIGTHSRNGSDANLFGPAYDGPPIAQFVFAP